MKPSASLDGLYDEWLTLTRAEEDAIRLSAWDLVDRYQGQKFELQPLILSATQEYYRGTAAAERKARQEHVRRRVEQLMEMEQRNHAILAQRRLEVQAELEETDRSRRNLRHLHRLYAPARQAAWQSYS